MTPELRAKIEEASERCVSVCRTVYDFNQVHLDETAIDHCSRIISQFALSLKPEPPVEGKNAGWAYGLANCSKCGELSNDYHFLAPISNGKVICTDCYTLKPEPPKSKCRREMFDPPCDCCPPYGPLKDGPEPGNEEGELREAQNYTCDQHGDREDEGPGSSFDIDAAFLAGRRSCACRTK